MVTVKHLTKSDKKQVKSFIDFPHDLYKDCPNYVPEMFIAQRDLLTKHPFLKHSEIELFMAYDDAGKPVGRIGAILNNNHNATYHVQDGFFGFFDTINDETVAQSLFDAVQEWLKTKNVNRIKGPVNPSTNETCGLLIEGFDSPPVAMMTYNFPYYLPLIEKAGFKKETDLLAYDIDAENYDDRPFRIMDVFRKRLADRGITIRKANLKDFKNEIAGIAKVYNKAWDKNLGFVPMTDDEFFYMAKDLKMIVDPDFCLVAEHKGEFVGFALCIPDINQIMRKVKRGRLLPTGIFKLLLGKKKIDTIRVITLGVIEGYRKLGIEAVFYGMIIKHGKEKHITHAEASWILEDNPPMNLALQHIHGKPYKKYRLFEKAIS